MALDNEIQRPRVPAMDVHVISLVASTQRRACVTREFARVGVPFSFFAAVRGDDGRRCFGGVDERGFLLRTGREPASGEIGCFASHRCLWQSCVERNTPIVVMEDDAQLEPALPAALAATSALIDRFGFLRLADEGPRSCAKTPIHAHDGWVVYYCIRYPYGSLGYAVAPRVAAALLEASRVLASPLDLFIKQFWAHGQPLFALCPYSVSGSVHRYHSTIEYRGHRKPGWDLRLLRVAQKTRDTLQRALFNRRMLATWTASPGAAMPATERPAAPAKLVLPHSAWNRS
jgi:glycosyl transferase family 25